MKRFTYAALASLLLSFGSLSACSCGTMRSFCEMTTDLFATYPDSSVVAHARYLGLRTPLQRVYLHDFELISTLRGIVVTDTISLLGQDGLNCNGPIIEMDAGSEYVMLYATNEFGVDQQFPEYENPYSVYHFFGCGHAALRLEEGLVRGDIAPGVGEIAFDELMDDLDECATEGTVSDFNPESIRNSVRVFPNPATERITVAWAGRATGIEVLDITGRVRLSATSVGLREQHEFDVSQLPAGVYVVRLAAAQGVVARKVVVK